MPVQSSHAVETLEDFERRLNLAQKTFSKTSAAERLGINERSLDELIRTGELPAYRIGTQNGVRPSVAGQDYAAVLTVGIEIEHLDRQGLIRPLKISLIGAVPQRATKPIVVPPRPQPAAKPVASEVKWQRGMVNGHRIGKTDQGFGLYRGPERTFTGQWFPTKEAAIAYAETL
jgi:excisionase family DNA binding protein